MEEGSGGGGRGGGGERERGGGRGCEGEREREIRRDIEGKETQCASGSPVLNCKGIWYSSNSPLPKILHSTFY